MRTASSETEPATARSAKSSKNGASVYERSETIPSATHPTSELSKKKLDKVLTEGDAEAAAVVQGAVEEFASELATVLERLLKLKAWRDTERVVVGGGLRDSRIGELAIARAALSLKGSGQTIDVKPIQHHPDEGGLIGAAHLVPSWMFEGHDAILAVDIGGSNIRVGTVEINRKKNGRIADAKVHEFDLWCHADEATKPSREDAVKRLHDMLARLVRHADKEHLKLAPFVGIACPGVITSDGHIERGGQNLPGNWESNRFNLPARVRELLPNIGKHETTIVMHNDAVVQGLSELPFIQDVTHWAVLTIGTGLGNASFTNAKDASGKPVSLSSVFASLVAVIGHLGSADAADLAGSAFERRSTAVGDGSALRTEKHAGLRDAYAHVDGDASRVHRRASRVDRRRRSRLALDDVVVIHCERAARQHEGERLGDQQAGARHQKFPETTTPAGDGETKAWTLAASGSLRRVKSSATPPPTPTSPTP